MKRLLFSLIAIGLLSTSINAQNLKKGSIIESKDEISCASFGHMEFAADGISQYSGAFLTGYLSNANCKNMTEGMDLKVVKYKQFKGSYAGKTKGVLVKLPTGMTTWIAR
ncbi:hypothetical protein [Sulfurimonas hongkongensis]|uniref:hypothetical protein n=1 Tax=Sulfurimonas hongkongensis TaxID=1172190 RepID=UPI00042640F2|nr:hypothetical protein [Sulfurimonas hongkongensis]